MPTLHTQTSKNTYCQNVFKNYLFIEQKSLFLSAKSYNDWFKKKELQ